MNRLNLWLGAALTALTVAGAACTEDDSTSSTSTGAQGPTGAGGSMTGSGGGMTGPGGGGADAGGMGGATGGNGGATGGSGGAAGGNGGAGGAAGGNGGAAGGNGGAAGGNGGAGGAACVGSTTIMLNEIRYDPPNNDNGDEWIELYNSSAGAIDVSNWTIAAGTTPANYSVRFTFPANTSIAAMGYLVVGGSNVGNADLTSSTALNMGNAGSSGDGVRLIDDANAIIDTVIYGPNNNDGFPDDCVATAVSLVPGGFNSEVIARSPNGADTNLTGNDFIRTQTPTMGAANP